jgi:hypothetical protein
MCHTIRPPISAADTSGTTEPVTEQTLETL